MVTADRQESHTAKMISIPKPADRLGICNGVGIIILTLAAAAAVIVFIDAAHRNHIDQEKSIQLVRIFGLNRLTVVPSGRVLRMSGLQNYAVDSRYDPQLARIQPGPADLVLKARD